MKVQSNLFDSQIISAVSEIAERLQDEAIFCGSLVLKMHGLLDRLVMDLDVITRTSMYGTKEGEDLLFRDSSGRFNVDGSEVLCVHGGTKAGIKVDYFYLNDWNKIEHKIEIVDWYDGIKLQVQHIDEVIAAKRAYVRSGIHDYKAAKHERDLELAINRLTNQR